MAFRFIFESDGDGVRVRSKTRVDMIAPELPADPPEPAPGVYAELRDASEQTLYRANLSAQIAPTVEVFAPTGKVERVNAPGEKRIAVVVVPEAPEAASVVVVRRHDARQAGDVRLESIEGDEELARASLLDDEDSR
ncbi:MAG TPA: hypothetical protein VGD79_11500 [Thermoanaerobaculia bacterium]|jgi:hypothetical protein